MTDSACPGCGADIESDAKTCPYCGHSIAERVTARASRASPSRTSGQTERTFAIERDSGTVRFGDGVTGGRVASGADSVRASYRRGVGSGRNVTCPSCHHIMKKRRLRTRRKCERCGTHL